ncbi:uncharacterized protein [Rhodnius prolixus]|uniref:Uncharacterized protein n=1 Tax=Rhodnius prolixus TaxID=13249 RepID=T1HPV7_RHOPR
MNKFETFIVLNVLLISSIACYNPACNGKYESGVLQFEKRIRRENIRGSMVGKHHYDTKSRQDLVAKADSKRHIINEVPKSEKDDCKSAFNEVSTRKNKSLLHEIARDLQKRAVKHQPKLTEKKKKNSKLGKQSTNEMENLLMAKLVALLKPIKKLNDPEPKHEYITLTRKKRYSNQNDYDITPDQQILSMDENPLYNEEQSIIPERYSNQNDYYMKPQQSYIDESDYLPNGEPTLEPSDILEGALFRQRSNKKKIYRHRPFDRSIENQLRYIDENENLPEGESVWKPRVLGLGTFSSQRSPKNFVITIKQTALSPQNPLRVQQKNLGVSDNFPRARPKWQSSDLVRAGFSKQMPSSQQYIVEIQSVAPSLKNQQKNFGESDYLEEWKTHGTFSGHKTPKRVESKTRPVPPSERRPEEDQQKQVKKNHPNSIEKPRWKSSDVAHMSSPKRRPLKPYVIVL